MGRRSSSQGSTDDRDACMTHSDGVEHEACKQMFGMRISMHRSTGCTGAFTVVCLLSRCRIRNASNLRSICRSGGSHTPPLRSHTRNAMLIVLVFVKPCIQSLDRYLTYRGKGIEIYYTFIHARKRGDR